MTVELIDHMGSDLSVVNAARVSFDKESDWETIPFGDC
jgi:thymidylate synthase (FAD)